MNILFSGSSGTGKTLAAGILARDLGLEIYKVDLSTVVSKYIGETEKNINKIFAEAREINAILFFDEADAIFGKRSEVKDSHDRYANIEVSYLLQKMEEHEGIVIMATNLSNNIDDAFVRRMHFIVEFPFPDEAGRLRIWKSLLPSEAPLSEDVDFQFLASHFKLAGGNIKNILMAAAFMAAESTGFINMEHIIKATVNEYKKVGLICSQSDFGKYYHLVNKKILKN
jgi:SpoVK/Ycf46/Vps4 family AAA+-type ATPase